MLLTIGNTGFFDHRPKGGEATGPSGRVGGPLLRTGSDAVLSRADGAGRAGDVVGSARRLSAARPVGGPGTGARPTSHRRAPRTPGRRPGPARGSRGPAART